MHNSWKIVALGTLGLSLTLGTLVSAATTKPSDSTPPSAPAKPGDAGLAAIKTAVAALQKEYADFEANPPAEGKEGREGKGRQSDYFRRNPSGDVTQLQILNALNQNYGRDTATDAYVKWQLLSAVAGKWDDALVRQGLAAYQNSLRMQLVNHPGLAHQALDAIAAKCNAKTSEDQIAALNDKVKTAIDAVRKQNFSVLAYRNQLFSLLPGSPDTFDLAMQDAANRMSYGLDADSIMTPVKAAVTEWVGDAKPGQLTAMAAQLEKLGAIGTNDRMIPYINPLAGEKGAYKWTKGNLIDAKGLDTLAETLRKDVAHPPEQLGFKKDE